VKESALAKVRRFVPPAAWDALRARVGTRFLGNYATWEEAMQACEGYDAPAILERVEKATRAVVSGEAPFERDSILFDRVEYSWPLLASLLWIAARRDGRLRVVDFGGALGSSYRQNAKFLAALKEVSWSIVEQANFVELGKREFETKELRFHADLEECLASTKPDVVVFSSVLQYLPEPDAVLELVERSAAPFVIIDRTPFVDAPNDRLTMQVVSKRVYPASYPCRFFSYERFVERVRRSYRVVEEFEPADRAVTVKSRYLGFLLERV
jgi:putative methyltransferase (TIGR04325 family)